MSALAGFVHGKCVTGESAETGRDLRQISALAQVSRAMTSTTTDSRRACRRSPGTTS